jgi:hypothetical protein
MHHGCTRPHGVRHRSWLNRIEVQFTALRYFALDGIDYSTYETQDSMIRRYIIWRNRNASDNHLKAPR